ncbi:MAG TPA: methionyl-tRNA formyltransferase [Candidatus Limnocylindrales bacterium]|nr:methionyl-tRNA formyltransferase [Candidatus Limnocylindrales bacterium]
MGTPHYAAVSLRRLLEGPHEVVAVVTRADKARGRGQRMVPSPVKEVALRAGVEVLDPASPRSPQFIDRLRALAPDLGVTVAYGRILPPQVLAIPRLGCINAHGSLLPALRGAAPIERAILEGLTRTGVTIMEMSEGLDEGDILAARSIDIPPDMNAGELRDRMAELSADMLAETVDRYAAGAVPHTPQDHSRATFAPPLRKEEAAIDWAADAAFVARQVRAFAPRPGAFAFDGKTRLKVLDARAVDSTSPANSGTAGGGGTGLAGAGSGGSGLGTSGSGGAAPSGAPGTVLGHSDGGVLVACGRGVLELRTVQPEGKRAMSALDYERGHRTVHGGRVLLPGVAASETRSATVLEPS